MFSKYLAVLIVTSALVLSCAKENEPLASTVKVPLEGKSECLSHASERVSAYLNGRMSQDEVVEFWNCASRAIADYQRLTVGEGPQGEYTPEAVRRFLQRYFLQSLTVQDPMLARLMELKRVFVSGSTDYISTVELERLRVLMDEFKAMSLELHPHISVLAGDKQDPNDEELDQAARAFARALTRLGEWLGARNESYSFAEMEALVDEIKAWSEPEDRDLLETLDRGFTVLAPSKRILVGGHEDGIAGAEWPKVMNALGQGFYLYFILDKTAGKDLNSVLVRQIVPVTLLEMGSLLESAVRERQGGIIPTSEWRALFLKLKEAGWLDEDISEEAVINAWEWALTRLLGDGTSAPEGLKLEHVQRFQARAQQWADLDRRTRSDPEGGARTADSADHQGFDQVLQSSEPMSWDGEGRLEHPDKVDKAWSPQGERRMVWPYVLVDWVKTAFVGVEPNSLSAEQLEEIVAEILPVLQSFGWLTSTETSIARRLTREADLFTLASNGNSQLELSEAVRYLAFVASAYRATEIWMGEAQVQCPKSKPECLRRLAVKEGERILGPLPRLRQSLGAQPEQEFAHYMHQAEETVLDQIQTEPFAQGDLMLVWMLFQYVETFYLRFDENQSERIRLAEALRAFEVFGPTLEDLLSPTGLPEEDVLAFFTYMMKYGDTPFTMFGGQVLFLHWRWHRNDWEFQAARPTLMSILNQLSKL